MDTMNPVTVLLGVAMILYGLYTLYMRRKDPSKFGKLEAMRDRFGAGTGNLIHLIAYSIVPLVAGAIFVVIGLQGHSIF